MRQAVLIAEALGRTCCSTSISGAKSAESEGRKSISFFAQRGDLPIIIQWEKVVIGRRHPSARYSSAVPCVRCGLRDIKEKYVGNKNETRAMQNGLQWTNCPAKLDTIFFFFVYSQVISTIKYSRFVRIYIRSWGWIPPCDNKYMGINSLFRV